MNIQPCILTTTLCFCCRSSEERQTASPDSECLFIERKRGLGGSILRSLVVLAFVAMVASLVAGEPATLPKLPIGMNLAPVKDYSTGYPFKNLMWGARPWMTKNADLKGPFDTEMAGKIPLDKDGYPLELPFQPEGSVEQPQIVFTIIPNVTEPGQYVVLYDGEGEIVGAMNTKVVESAPGRVVVNLSNTGKNGDYEGIMIKSSTKGNHIRNIRILRLEDEKADLAANPFRDDFLAYVKQWHALRFMEWQVTSDSLEKEWNGRKLPTFYTMVANGGDPLGFWSKPTTPYQQLFAGGVAMEVMIQLANMTKIDPWFCVPHRATPEYMTEMAKLIKEKLDPSLKAYIEYSNEVWNSGFKEMHWMMRSKVAADAVIAAGGRAWKNDQAPTEFPYEDGTVAKDAGESHPERMGALDRRCFKQFEDVFTGADRARIVRVIAVQHAWLDTVKRTVKFVMDNGGADAVAAGGYFMPSPEIYDRWEATGASLTADQVIADMNEAFEKDTSKWTRGDADVAKEYNLKYLVYEGGQHIQPKGQKETAYMPALKEAQFSKGLYDIYMKNFALHQEVGCDLFCAFDSISKQGTRWGSFGHQEYYGQPRSEIPKFGALLDANTPK